MTAAPPPSSRDPLSVGLNPPTTPATAGPGPAAPAPGTTAPAGTATDRTAPSQAPARERRAGRTIGRSVALALLLFVTVVLVLFVVFNDQTVPISLVFGDVDAPLVLALLIAAALGGLLVWLAGLVRRARRRHR
jgi:uncharacterized integral membrane protein